MKKDAIIFLHDILESIGIIEEYLEGNEESDFFASRQMQDAIMRRIAIIGEAINNVPKIIQEKYPEIEWAPIVAMRNILIHAYNEVSLPRVWDVSTKEIGILKKQIQKIKKDLEKK